MSAPAALEVAHAQLARRARARAHGVELERRVDAVDAVSLSLPTDLAVRRAAAVDLRVVADHPRGRRQVLEPPLGDLHGFDAAHVSLPPGPRRARLVDQVRADRVRRAVLESTSPARFSSPVHARERAVRRLVLRGHVRERVVPRRPARLPCLHAAAAPPPRARTPRARRRRAGAARGRGPTRSVGGEGGVPKGVASAMAQKAPKWEVVLDHQQGTLVLATLPLNFYAVRRAAHRRAALPGELARPAATRPRPRTLIRAAGSAVARPSPLKKKPKADKAKARRRRRRRAAPRRRLRRVPAARARGARVARARERGRRGAAPRAAARAHPRAPARRAADAFDGADGAPARAAARAARRPARARVRRLLLGRRVREAAAPARPRRPRAPLPVARRARGARRRPSPRSSRDSTSRSPTPTPTRTARPVDQSKTFKDAQAQAQRTSTTWFHR